MAGWVVRKGGACCKCQLVTRALLALAGRGAALGADQPAAVLQMPCLLFLALIAPAYVTPAPVLGYGGIAQLELAAGARRPQPLASSPCGINAASRATYVSPRRLPDDRTVEQPCQAHMAYARAKKQRCSRRMQLPVKRYYL